MTEIGAVFAATAGRLVPGLQLMLWGGEGLATQTVVLDGAPEVVQAWSAAGMSIERDGATVTITCADADPLCAVGFGAESIGATVTPIGVAASWSEVATGVAVDPRTLELPETLGSGWNLWWNPDRPLEVGGYEETLERLRALGYIE